VDLNRALRREGLLHVHTNASGELLDPWTSRAFAVADHQIAHVYVRDPDDLPRVREIVGGLDGVDEVLDADGKAAYGLDHPRAGELVVVAEKDAWFTYYYWLDDARAPDFARAVEIHKKPGYDPAELFLDPADPKVKLRAAAGLLRKKVGLRYAMNVVPLDPSPVQGSHGRLPDDPADGPVLLCSDGSLARDRLEATDVYELLLELAGIPAAAGALQDPA
jgi:predicted AlkP superfamily pyrophosphatase or phosphodiesterase